MMTTLSWEALGGDPAPGDPDAFEEFARSFSETAENAGEAHARLTRFSTSVDATIWSGEAADGFREKIGELPPRLKKLHDSYAAAAEEMGEYGRTLRDLQAEARALLGKAQAAQVEKTSQERERDRAQAADPTASATIYEAAIADAQHRLSGVHHQIEELRERRLAAERRALGRLEDAEALGIRNDPWYKRAFNAIDRFIDEHADILRAISGALKVISAVAGVLSFIPFLTPIFGPIALIAGGLALLTDAALAATGNGDWKTLLVDAALMALPGAGRLLGTAMKGTRVGVATGRVVKSVKRAARSVGGKAPQGLTRRQFTIMSRKVRAGAGHLSDDIGVHGSRAAGTARLTSDIDIAVRMKPQQFEAFAHERFGRPNPGSAKERTMKHAVETGKVQAGEAGLRGLRQTIERDLGMEVDISVIKIGGPFDQGPYIPLH